jgi:hypothetical protein
MLIHVVGKLKALWFFVCIFHSRTRMREGDLYSIDLGVVLVDNRVFNLVLGKQKALDFEVFFELLLVSLAVFSCKGSFGLGAGLSVINDFEISERRRSKLRVLQLVHECFPEFSLPVCNRLPEERVLAQRHPVCVAVLVRLISKETLSPRVQLRQVVILVSLNSEKVRLVYFIPFRRGLQPSERIALLSPKRVALLA